MDPDSRRKRRFALPVLALLATACATGPSLAPPPDPLGALFPGALLYARLEGVALDEFLPALVPPEGRKALAPLTMRSESASFALLGLSASSGDSPPAALPTIAGTGDSPLIPLPAFEAIFVGEYPRGTASFALATDRAWRRENASFVHRATGLRAAIPGGTIVLASSRPLGELLGRMASPGPSPLPPRLLPFAGKDFLVWLPEPFGTLARALVGESFDLPVHGLLVAGEPTEAADVPANGSKDGDGAGDGAGSGAGNANSWTLSLRFEMDNERSARVYRPAARIAWYALARTLFPTAGLGILAPEFHLDGELVCADGIRIDGAELRAALARLSGTR